MSEYELGKKSLSKLHFFTSATDYCIHCQTKEAINHECVQTTFIDT